MLDIILLALAVCVDSFAMSASMSVKNIRFEKLSVILISFVNTLFLGVGLYLCELLPPVENASVISGFLLFVIAFLSLFGDKLKEKVRSVRKKPYLFDVFVDKTKADKDNSKILSPKEAVLLSLLLSADSLSVGLSAGISLTLSSKIISILLSFILGILLLIIGVKLSELAYKKLGNLSGIILFVLAILMIM